ncbi:hypothetical protein FHS25_000734 [Rhizobium laguerreae]|uniref:Uncharacterized protein n=1 Tax=Rhizobium laguerreae TaxID=1076926 RepID=A0ABR6G1Z9_9HYPH|nr:hypothetical protein [Rhizobium laguerreae]
MRECRPEIGGRFPDGIIEISRTFADGAMHLGRDKARLPFHEGRIGLPGIKEGLLIGLVEREEVDEDDRGGIDRDLAIDREGRVHRAHERHGRLHLIWLHDVNLVIWIHNQFDTMVSI